MKRYVSRLSKADLAQDHGVPDGVFLVQVERVRYCHARKAYLSLLFLVLEPENQRGRRFTARLYATAKAHLMSIHEYLPPEGKRELKQVGWSKGLELAKLARRNDGQDFDCATWFHKARTLPKEQFRHEVEKELTGTDSEPSELIYFKIYKSRIPVSSRQSKPHLSCSAATSRAATAWR